MKNVQRLYVVGDKFKGFAINEMVVPVSEMIARLSEQALNGTYEIRIGQGVNEDEYHALNNLLKDQPANTQIQLKRPSVFAQRSSRKLTHKHKDHNILISDPVEISPNVYQSQLMLDDNCAEMSDHVTGQHLQGMLLVEAARQLVNAITEKFLNDPTNKTIMRFVVKNIQSTFHQFVFPLSVNMIYETISLKQGPHNNFMAKSKISFYQNNKLTTDVTFDYGVLDAKFLDKKESLLAKTIISTHKDSTPVQPLLEAI